MTLSERLRAYCIDFDGSQMKDLASPLDGMTCGEVREAADELDRLTARVAEWQRLYRRALKKMHGPHWSINMTDPDQLPAFHVPLSPTMEKAVWLSDALTAIATERARADALKAALSDVLEMAQEHADHFAAAFAATRRAIVRAAAAMGEQ